MIQQLLKSRLNYNPETGDFTRKGKPAGWVSSNGYRNIWFNGKEHGAHRIAWLYVYGSLPDYIDHIDGNRLNNRIENLRECTQAQNLGNQKIQKNNTTGYKGVSRHRGRFAAKLKNKRLGIFNTVEEAAECYQLAAKAEFGEFYRRE